MHRANTLLHCTQSSVRPSVAHPSLPPPSVLHGKNPPCSQLACLSLLSFFANCWRAGGRSSSILRRSEVRTTERGKVARACGIAGVRTKRVRRPSVAVSARGLLMTVAVRPSSVAFVRPRPNRRSVNLPPPGLDSLPSRGSEMSPLPAHRRRRRRRRWRRYLPRSLARSPSFGKFGSKSKKPKSSSRLQIRQPAAHGAHSVSQSLALFIVSNYS